MKTTVVAPSSPSVTDNNNHDDDDDDIDVFNHLFQKPLYLVQAFQESVMAVSVMHYDMHGEMLDGHDRCLQDILDVHMNVRRGFEPKDAFTHAVKNACIKYPDFAKIYKVSAKTYFDKWTCK